MLEQAKLVSAGKFTSRSAWIHPTITTETTEIIVNTDGCWRIREGDAQYTLKPGTVLVLKPGVEHGGMEAVNERISFYWIHIADFPAETEELSKTFTLREPLHVSLLLGQLLHYREMGFGEDVTDRLLYVLLSELVSQSRADGENESALAWRIREWIRINADQPISAPDVAEKFGYNEDYVSRLLRRYYGGGLKTVISEFKVNQIKYLLLETDHTLAEIADAAGFADYKLFLKFFKYHAGMTPSEFRQVYYAIHTNNR